MKKLLFSICLLFTFSASWAQKDTVYITDPTPRVAVKLNGTLLLGVINPAVEFRVHRNISLQLEGIGVFQRDGFIWGITDIPLVSTMAFLQGRYYYKECFNGFFTGLHAGFATSLLSKGIAPVYWNTYQNEYQMGRTVLLGLSLGYQLLLSDHWGLDIEWSGGWTNTAYEGHRRSDGSMYVSWNKSGEWLPLYKGSFSVVYRW